MLGAEPRPSPDPGLPLAYVPVRQPALARASFSATSALVGRSPAEQAGAGPGCQEFTGGRVRRRQGRASRAVAPGPLYLLHHLARVRRPVRRRAGGGGGVGAGLSAPGTALAAGVRACGPPRGWAAGRREGRRTLLTPG